VQKMVLFLIIVMGDGFCRIGLHFPDVLVIYRRFLIYVVYIT
jgi:hypothetical protein